MNTRHGLAHQAGLQRAFISAKPNQNQNQQNETNKTIKIKFGFELAGLESRLPTASTTLSGALCQNPLFHTLSWSQCLTWQQELIHAPCTVALRFTCGFLGSGTA